MKKITFLVSMFALIFSFQANAQYGCGSAVVLTDGYTADAITTPGTGGAEDWNDNPADSCSSNALYWDDDVYLFTYTAGATDEEVSMTIFSRNGWNALGIFDNCDGTAFDTCLGSDSSSSSNVSRTVSANISAGQTVYFAVGQWGAPNDLDFDVTAFSATPLVNPPSCVQLDSPADTATDITSPTLTWPAATGAPTAYILTVGTTSGGTDVVDNVNVGNVLTYDLASLTANTTYYVTVTPTNSNGDATGCVETSFTTAGVPACTTNEASTPDASCGNFDVPLSWDAAANATGYYLTVGTTSGGNDVMDNVDLGNVTSTDVVAPAIGTTYYWTVTPYNTFGAATGCTENTFDTVGTGCYCDSVPTSNDGQGIDNLQVATTDFPSGGDITYEDFTGAPVDVAQGITANVQITFITGYTYGTNIWIDLNDNYTFEASELMYTGESTSDNPTTLDASFIVPADAALGVHRMRIVTDDTNSDAANPCNSGSFGVTMDVEVNVTTASCSPPVATAAIVPDCDNLQFFIDVDVTGLGDGTPEITDGTNTWPITGTGVVQIGPFADGTALDLTVTHGSDSTCDLPLGNFDYTCPAPNDNCADAIAYTLSEGVCSTNTVINTDIATEDPSELTSCDGFGNLGVWYTFEAPANGTVEFVSGAGSPGITVFDGTCGTFTEVLCLNNTSGTISGLTGGTTYYAMIWTDSAQTAAEFCLYYLNCTPATVNYTVVNDCDNSGGFMIDVEITDLGTATNITVSNDQDATTHAVTATGTVQFGPFTNGTDVVITVADDADATCNQSSSALTQVACPPANDNLCNAIALNVGDAGVSGAYTNIAATTETDEPQGTCFNNGAQKTVWFSFVAPTSGEVRVSTDIGGTMTDSEIAIYDATGVTCSDLTTLAAPIDCDQDGGDVVGSGFMSVLEFTNADSNALTAGTTYYVQVSGYNNNDGTFGIEVMDLGALSLNDVSFQGFKYFPNPVNDQLYLSAINNIDQVQVYNMLGQEVLRITPNTLEAEIGMADLNAGAYFVKVSIGEASKTIKVLKK